MIDNETLVIDEDVRVGCDHASIFRSAVWLIDEPAVRTIKIQSDSAIEMTDILRPEPLAVVVFLGVLIHYMHHTHGMAKRF